MLNYGGEALPFADRPPAAIFTRRRRRRPQRGSGSRPPPPRCGRRKLTFVVSSGAVATGRRIG